MDNSESKATFGQRTQSGDKQNERRKNTEKYGPHKNETMNQGARGEQAVPVSYKILVVFLIVTSGKSLVGDEGKILIYVKG